MSGKWLTCAVLVLVGDLSLIQVHGPQGQLIWVNPAQVTTLRQPFSVNSVHFAKGTQCLVFLASNSFVATAETCDQVRVRLTRCVDPC